MTRKTRCFLLACTLALLPRGAFAESQDAPREAASAERAWQINGIRLEPGQVERLADDMARRTVEAVEQNVEGIALRDEQRPALREVYRQVSLDVYDQVVTVVSDDTLSDTHKEESVRELVLDGQKRSHALLAPLLDDRQMRLYSEWEDRQVSAFRSKRWETRRRRRRR